LCSEKTVIIKKNNMSSPKYFISYFMLVGFIAAVLAITLLVSLTSSLAGVERSNCKNSSNKTSSNLNYNGKSLEIKETRARRYKNDAAYFEKMEELKQLRGRKKLKINENLKAPSCGSLFSQDTNGTLWQSPRLQKNVIPLRYNIEFYLEYIFLQSYNGLVNISLVITEDLNTIILHSHLLDIYTTLLRDNSNTLIPIQCADYYPGFFKYY